jgi:hypothetical protein
MMKTVMAFMVLAVSLAVPRLAAAQANKPFRVKCNQVDMQEFKEIDSQVVTLPSRNTYLSFQFEGHEIRAAVTNGLFYGIEVVTPKGDYVHHEGWDGKEDFILRLGIVRETPPAYFQRGTLVVYYRVGCFVCKPKPGDKHYCGNE